VTTTPTIEVNVPAQRTRRADGDGLETWPLVERAKAGDAEAFAELYRLHRDLVFRMAFVRVGRDPHLADDITSTTFLRAWRSIPRIEYRGRDFAALLMTIARNLIADHYKSAAVQLGTCLTFGDDTNDAPQAGEPMWIAPEVDPARNAERAELRATIEAAFDNLSPAQARILRRRYLDGWSVEETAVLEGMTVGAVKAVTFRAVRALRRAGALEAHR